MTILFFGVIFVVVVIAISLLGLKLWVRPQEAIERVAGVGMETADTMPAHPSLAFHELLKNLGDRLPTSPKDANVIQKRLIRAGYRDPGALKVLYGSKLALAIVLPLIMSAAVAGSDASVERKLLAILASAAAGFLGPNEFIKIAARRRQTQIRRGLPNGIDLMVVCVESGLGLDQAMVQVSKELEHAHPEISEEFVLVNLELKAGNRRADALRNLAERTGVDDLRKLVAVLIQADRFGTGVAPSLRGHAEYMRVQSRQVAEEKAAKLGVKLIFPIFFCILPSLFVVTVGPMAVRIVREVVPMINNI
jgi:tight adherence protein C